MIRFLSALLLSLAATLPAHAAAPQAADPKVLRILFIGNSLTYTNDLPSRLARVAQATGREAHVKMIARADFSLEDHWTQKTATDALAAEKWDVVVLQQGPSTRADSREELIASTKRFAEVIRKAGAKPAIYMGWPRAGRKEDFLAVIEAHRAAAAAADAILIPAGEAWMRALAEQPRLRLYSDSLHPTVAGSDLAVLTHYFSLFPAGPQEFTEAYVSKIDAVLSIPNGRRDLFFDAATRAIDSPLAIQ
ncbi:hypothetical protein [Usitatibacter palustris]|uniref:SGNH/GDSL hydrolase family protein n=1 Tax=Usitatibacter palustris TaxID=2732487 RepID=A0A6M4H6R8_9PROT|nr:hypothetical protein [Usitatibacter palustris]QJR13647.1 hypothetical protein DSM104440_00432 [Usitatibacter palustris]